MNYYKNGILIQQINEKNIFLKKYADSFFYNGVHALNTAPLVWFKKDKDAYELFIRQGRKKIKENEYKPTDFSQTWSC